MKQLRISPDLTLPLEAATRRLAILAMSGAGKSNVAVVLAEQMFDAGIPWVAIDPKGDWWGVRSSKDGKGPGLPIPIFGGLHGDIPLEPTAGKLVGEMIVDQRLTCVLDISEFAERQQQWAFLIDLGETLLRRNRQVLHLFLEEADEYLPQRTSEKGNLPRCLGVWQRVVKRGRFRGIGSTQITQRNASLNKDTLYQAEALIAMRASGKADREAVKGWVEHHSSSDEIVASLATLGDGEGWISSPAWLKTTKRLTFDRRRTFDSGATPVMLKGTAAPATLADVDLETLRTRMAATIEKSKADDPKELRKQIAQLKGELAKAGKHPRGDKVSSPDPVNLQRQIAAAVVEERNRVKQERRALHRQLAKLRDDYMAGASALQTAMMRLTNIGPDFAQLVDAMKADPPAPAAPSSPTRRVGIATFAAGVPATTQGTAVRTRAPGVRNDAHGTPSSNGHVSRPQQKVLNALAELEVLGVASPSRAQLGMLSGYNLTGGSGGQHVADLAGAGHVETGNGVVRLTESGRAIAVTEDTPTSLRELHQRVLAKLSSGQRRIAEHLISIYPESISRAALGEATGYNLTGGSGGQHVADLVTLGAAEIPVQGSVVASALLFPEGLS